MFRCLRVQQKQDQRLKNITDSIAIWAQGLVVQIKANRCGCISCFDPTVTSNFSWHTWMMMTCHRRFWIAFFKGPDKLLTYKTRLFMNNWFALMAFVFGFVFPKRNKLCRISLHSQMIYERLRPEKPTWNGYYPMEQNSHSDSTICHYTHNCLMC